MRAETEVWVAVAEIDFRTAKRLMEHPDPIPESACFHAQQCIETYLQAELEEAGRPIPRTHDLGVLLALVLELEPDVGDLMPDIEAIVPYAVALRYPGGIAPSDDLGEEAAAATATMEAVRVIVRRRLGVVATDRLLGDTGPD